MSWSTRYVLILSSELCACKRLILSAKGSPQEASEKIHARYLMSCDGAHSWVRHQLQVATEGDGESRQWGVLDIVPITDFRESHFTSLTIAKNHYHLIRSSRYPPSMFGSIWSPWKHYDGTAREPTCTILYPNPG